MNSVIDIIEIVKIIYNDNLIKSKYSYWELLSQCQQVYMQWETMLIITMEFEL